MTRLLTQLHRTRCSPTVSFPGVAASALTLALALSVVLPPAHAGISSDSPRPGAPGIMEPPTGSLLVDYYEAFLRDRDIESFRLNVLARYTEGTLTRLLESSNPEARRSAVLALGLVGSFKVNAALARALRDSDATVRSLADNALWAVWFRADTPENNAALEQVVFLIGRQQPEKAIEQATRLIAVAPKFAEAYNQRAIAYFKLGDYQASAADCRRVLERNPYHIGALGGLAQCQLRLDQRQDALKTLRRALKLQPFSEGLREVVASLEAEDR